MHEKALEKKGEKVIPPSLYKKYEGEPDEKNQVLKICDDSILGKLM
jgi:hypothetical protein